MATQKKISIAARLDSAVKKLEETGTDEIRVLVGIAEHMPPFYELLLAGAEL